MNGRNIHLILPSHFHWLFKTPILQCSVQAVSLLWEEKVKNWKPTQSLILSLENESFSSILLTASLSWKLLQNQMTLTWEVLDLIFQKWDVKEYISYNINFCTFYCYFFISLFSVVLLRGCWLDGTNKCLKNGAAEVCTCSSDLCNAAPRTSRTVLPSIICLLSLLISLFYSSSVLLWQWYTL